jgi:putative transcriptional regulator
MFAKWLSRLILILTTSVVPATFLKAAYSCCDKTSTLVSLTGRLLVASPEIRDPNFDHAVILVVRHDQGGAMGIVINRPTEERSLADILKILGEADTDVKGKVQLFAGGPVQPGIGFVTHSADYRGTGTIDVTGSVLVTSNLQILRDIGRHKGPKKSIISFGYAGWAPGQLEDELQRRVWFTAPGDPDLVFDENREKLWDTVYARRSQDL